MKQEGGKVSIYTAVFVSKVCRLVRFARRCAYTADAAKDLMYENY